MRVKMEIKGLSDIIRNLDRLDVRKEFVEAANRSVAEVEKRAISEVPVDTSMLQQSHIFAPATTSRPEAEVYTDKEYAVPVHEGHRTRSGSRVPPNKWMERAVRKSQGKINSIFNKAGDLVAKIITK